jgi:hypothetical protein
MSNVLVVANQTLAGEEVSEFVKSRMVKKLPSSGCLSRLLRARHTGSKAHGCSATFPGACPGKTLSTVPRTPPIMSRHESDSNPG